MTLYDKKTIIERTRAGKERQPGQAAKRRPDNKGRKRSPIWLAICTAALLCGCYGDQSAVPSAPRPLPELTLTIASHTFRIAMHDGPSARAFAAMLPLEVTMRELNGNEKYCYLDVSLPAQPVRPGTIQAGDLMLYGTNCIVLFYESFRSDHRYTPLGRVEAEDLKQAVGDDELAVAFQVVEKKKEVA